MEIKTTQIEFQHKFNNNDDYVLAGAILEKMFEENVRWECLVKIFGYWKCLLGMFDVGAESKDTIRNLVTYDEDVTILIEKRMELL